MPDEIELTIDGIKVRTRVGRTVLEAANEAGIYIPYLCYHPGMKPYAACRMCLVEIEGQRGFPASCTTPVAKDMVVRTATEQLHSLRKGINDTLIAEHPHGCLTCHRVDLCGPEDVCLRHVSVNDRCVLCPKNERCELKDTTRYLTMELESPLNYVHRDLPLLTADPFYDRDYNLCIVCGRCVRVCAEVRADDALCFTSRSGKALVGTAHGVSLLESGCEFCGACVDVCPVGALTEKQYKWEKPDRVVRTVCANCPVGCQMNLEVNRFEKVIRAVPELSAPANRGQACYRGKFGLDFVNRTERVRKPLVRRDGQLVQATWEEALGAIAGRLPAHKGGSFALVASARGTNEDLYVAQKFARAVMGSDNVDVDTNLTPELTAGLEEALGYPAATNPIWELRQAGCIISFNNNITEDQTVAAVPVKQAARDQAKLIVIDPREVELTRYAALWLRPRPGTELLLLGGLLKSIVLQGAVKQDFIDSRTEGWDGLRAEVDALDLDAVSRETEVSRESIETAARLYAGAKSSAIVYGLDNIPAELQRDCVRALAGMAVVTGNVGKPSSGLYPLRSGTNEQGAYDVGCVPGTRTKDEGPGSKGLGMRELAGAIRDGQVKALLVLGPGGRLAPEIQAVAADLELLVVQDAFMGPLARQAHVVLPEATFAEKAGTYTNLERRIQHLGPVIQPKNTLARPFWWTLSELARRLGAGGFDYPGPSAILREIGESVSIYRGVTLEGLEARGIITLRPDPKNPLPTQVLYSDKRFPGVVWPTRDGGKADTPVLYTESFPRGKARLVAPAFRSAAVAAAADSRLMLVPGRLLLQSDREMSITESGHLNHIERLELVQLHAEDASALGIGEGDVVEIETASRRLKARVELHSNGNKGLARTVGLFGQLAESLQRSEHPDPMALAPELPVEPAKIRKAPAP